MLSGKTILVAEDNEEDAFLLKRSFLKAEVNVRLVFVCDGQETIDYLKGEEQFADREEHPFPQLLLLDLKMPRLDGFDVLRWVRRQSRLKRLPVTVLTSSSLSADVNRAFDLGANSYLVKPSGTAGLIEIVEKLHGYWMKLNECPDCGC